MQHKELACSRSNALVKAYPNKGEFLVEFNFDACLNRYSEFNTPERALESNKIKLKEIALAYDKQTPVSMIEFWLINLASYMNIEASDQQIREVAIYLYEDNSFFNLAEITLFFKRLKKGYYGSFYGRFDGMMICNAAREYRQQRGNILARLPEEQQNRIV